MRRPILLIDAFAERPFTGNPAGVMLLDHPLPEAAMQAVAMEMAQAETAFAVARADGGWDLRWFTPTTEVGFCGHATLATAHALAEAGRGGDLLAFHTREVGVLRVRVAGAGRYVLDLPRIEPEPRDLAVLGGLVPGATEAFAGGGDVVAVVPSEAHVRAYRPDLAAIAALPGVRGLALTARGAEADIVSRFFGPAAGIPEDAVTGSLHAMLVPLWAPRLGRDTLTAVQASARGGRIAARLEPARVHLTGSAVTTLRGEIDLPD